MDVVVFCVAVQKLTVHYADCRLYSSDFMNQNLKNWTANNFWFYFECKHLSHVVFKDLRRPQQVQSGAEVCGTL